MSESQESRDRDIGALLWHFTEQFFAGSLADPIDIICDSPSTLRDELTRELLRTCAELKSFDLEWLNSQLLNPRLCLAAAVKDEIIRCVYRDMVSLRRSVSLEQFESIGIAASELSLKSTDDRLHLGETIGGSIRIVERLGAGGVAVVYRGVSLADGHEYAVRVARNTGSAADEKAKELIRNECLLLQRFSINGVPRVYDLIETQDGPVGIVEFVRGQPPKIGPNYCSEENALEIAAKVACIVDEFHRLGFVHGDIKVGNVLISDTGRVYLNDFNVSRSANPSRHSDGPTLGTPGKMSPESTLGVAADVDIREDVYSLGVLLYELLEGKSLASPANREEAVVMSILLGGVHEPEFHASVNDFTNRIVRCAISRQPDKRFETARDFSDACLAGIDGNYDLSLVSRRNSFIASWRLGSNLGLIATRLAIVRRAMAESLATHSQDKLPKVFHYGMGHAIGVSLALEDAIRNAGYLGIEIEEPAFSKLFANLFYRKSTLNQEAVPKIQSATVEAEKWFKETYGLLQRKLRTKGPLEFLLLSFGLETRFVPHSETARRKWSSIAAATTLPRSIWEEFAEVCASDASEPEWENELGDLEHRVVRWLRWRIS